MPDGHHDRSPVPGTRPWPDGVRCAVLLTCDFDGPSHEIGRGLRPLGINSWGRYSGRRGVARVLDLFERNAVPATFFVPGYDAECYPDVVRDIHRRGFEVASHGYLHESWALGDEEAELLARTHGILGNLLGTAPVGWRSPSGRKTARTLRVLHELGYRYDSSDKDFDLPYLARIDGTRRTDMVEFPNNTSVLDDMPLFRFSATPPSEVLTLWQREFDAIYAEHGYFILTFHPRSGWGSGSPSRVAIIDALIRYMQSFEGVRFYTLAGLADWCLAHHERFE
ncbi:MAG: polysaccharide deacetylase family protein [Burkholderiales bacterium]